MSGLFDMAKRFLTDSGIRFNYLEKLGIYNHLSDEEFLRRKFQAHMGYPLDLDNPKTYNEKLQWLKIYNRRPEYKVMVDKFLARDYIKEKLGEEYLIPLLGVWDDPDKIDFDALPDQFVLKCNHNSGLGMCVCKDKSKLDIKKVKAELRLGLAQNYYLTGREWPYKDVPRRIIAEEYMEDEKYQELRDYKFMCFNGTAKSVFACSNRFDSEGLHITILDREWNVLPFERKYPSYKEGIDKPQTYEEMLSLAERLSQGIPFLRVDFYEVNGRCYFGEMTFYPASGFGAFSPEEWDKTFGSWINLPG